MLQVVRLGMTTKRHHFVPQGFLRGFTADHADSRKMLWVYDNRPGRAPRFKSTRSIAWSPYYYAQERLDGSTDSDTLEIELARTIDNEIPPLIQAIRAIPGAPVALSPDDRGRLAFFLGISLTRVPSFREGINDFHSRLANIVLHQVASDDVSLDAMLKKYGVRAEAKPWVSLEAMVQCAHAIALSATEKRFQFFVPPPGVPLVTSDNPTVFSGGASGTTELGPAHPGAEIVMNLRKDLAVVCTFKRAYPDMHVFRLRPAEARKFNRGIVKAARLRVFASYRSDTLDRFVKKHAGTEQRIVV